MIDSVFLFLLFWTELVIFNRWLTAMSISAAQWLESIFWFVSSQCDKGRNQTVPGAFFVVVVVVAALNSAIPTPFLSTSYCHCAMDDIIAESEMEVLIFQAPDFTNKPKCLWQLHTDSSLSRPPVSTMQLPAVFFMDQRKRKPEAKVSRGRLFSCCRHKSLQNPKTFHQKQDATLTIIRQFPINIYCKEINALFLTLLSVYLFKIEKFQLVTFCNLISSARELSSNTVMPRLPY